MNGWIDQQRNTFAQKNIIIINKNNTKQNRIKCERKTKEILKENLKKTEQQIEENNTLRTESETQFSSVRSFWLNENKNINDIN